MASLRQLAAGIAHERNNPIGAINSNINLNESCYKKIEQVLSNTKGRKNLTNTKKILNIWDRNNNGEKTSYF